MCFLWRVFFFLHHIKAFNIHNLLYFGNSVCWRTGSDHITSRVEKKTSSLLTGRISDLRRSVLLLHRTKAFSSLCATTSTSHFRRDGRRVWFRYRGGGKKKLQNSQERRKNSSCLFCVRRHSKRRLNASGESLTDPSSLLSHCSPVLIKPGALSFSIFLLFFFSLYLSFTPKDDTTARQQAATLSFRLQRVLAGYYCPTWKTARSACWSSSLADVKFKSHNQIVCQRSAINGVGLSGTDAAEGSRWQWRKKKKTERKEEEKKNPDGGLWSYGAAPGYWRPRQGRVRKVSDVTRLCGANPWWANFSSLPPSLPSFLPPFSSFPRCLPFSLSGAELHHALRSKCVYISQFHSVFHESALFSSCNKRHFLWPAGGSLISKKKKVFNESFRRCHFYKRQ